MSSFAVHSQRVLLPRGLVPATVVVEDGQIARVGDDPRGPDVEDLGDLVLAPSLVDTHVHVNEPGRTEWEGYDTATRSAALGGVSMIVDMPLNCLPVTTTRAALDTKLATTTGKLWVDTGFWGGVVPGNLEELEPMVEGGVLGFKAFLCDSGIDEFPASDEKVLRPAMAALRQLSVPLLVHAELEGELREAAQLGSPREYLTWLHSRPRAWEDRAIAMMIELARQTGCRVHVVHLSSATALPLIAAAKADGVKITVETCPHYLCLRAEDVPDGATAFKCAPPIRTEPNREGLWEGLADGTIDFVVTDHSPCLPALKRPESGDFLEAWGGIASLQLGLPAVWSEARRRGHELPQVLRWMGAGPRRLLGLDGTGRLAPGQPADLVAFDPDGRFEVIPDNLAHRHPITPYAGQTLDGRVHHTWVRGHRVVQDGAIVGEPVGETVLGRKG